MLRTYFPPDQVFTAASLYGSASCGDTCTTSVNCRGDRAWEGFLAGSRWQRTQPLRLLGGVVGAGNPFPGPETIFVITKAQVEAALGAGDTRVQVSLCTTRDTATNLADGTITVYRWDGVAQNIAAVAYTAQKQLSSSSSAGRRAAASFFSRLNRTHMVRPISRETCAGDGKNERIYFDWQSPPAPYLIVVKPFPLSRGDGHRPSELGDFCLEIFSQ